MKLVSKKYLIYTILTERNGYISYLDWSEFGWDKNREIYKGYRNSKSVIVWYISNEFIAYIHKLSIETLIKINNYICLQNNSF